MEEKRVARKPASPQAVILLKGGRRVVRRTLSGYQGIIPEGFALCALLPLDLIDELMRVRHRPTIFVPVDELPTEHSKAWLAGYSTEMELLTGVFSDDSIW